MQSTRQNKICRLIQQDMGDIFLKEMKPVFGQSLITVTQVRITPDLSIARIYVSLMMIGGGTKEELLELIRENTPDLRRRLGLREGKQLRIPQAALCGQCYLVDFAHRPHGEYHGLDSGLVGL